MAAASYLVNKYVTNDWEFVLFPLFDNGCDGCIVGLFKPMVLYEGSFINNRKNACKSAFFYAINKILARVHTLTRPSFLYVTAQVCQHTSANAAPWNRYPLGRNFRQGFVAISAHGQQTLHRHQSAFLPAHVSVAQRGDNQMVRGLDCVVGVAKSPIHISLANLAPLVLCGV